jgi:DNA adenine methylase
MIGPLAYIGGKNRIAKEIIAIFPEHTTYVEAFAGGAQVSFRKEPSAVEVLNDLDGDVVNFFRVCQHHHDELLRHLKFILASRRWFALFEAENPASLTDIQRAARYRSATQVGHLALQDTWSRLRGGRKSGKQYK